MKNRAGETLLSKLGKRLKDSETEDWLEFCKNEISKINRVELADMLRDVSIELRPKSTISENKRKAFEKLKEIALNHSLLKDKQANLEKITILRKKIEDVPEDFGKTEGTRSVLRIPNRTVSQLIYGYIRDAWKGVDCFRVPPSQLSGLVGDMAYDGMWEPFFTFLGEQIKKQTSIHDYLREEKVIQGFLLAYLNVTDYFLSYSEFEANKGFIDIYLAAFQAKYPDLKYVYLIELKYLKREKGKTPSEKKVDSLVEEATTQLRQYEQDERIQAMISTAVPRKLVLVFHG